METEAWPLCCPGSMGLLTEEGRPMEMITRVDRVVAHDRRPPNLVGRHQPMKRFAELQRGRDARIVHLGLARKGSNPLPLKGWRSCKVCSPAAETAVLACRQQATETKQVLDGGLGRVWPGGVGAGLKPPSERAVVRYVNSAYIRPLV